MYITNLRIQQGNNICKILQHQNWKIVDNLHSFEKLKHKWKSKFDSSNRYCKFYDYEETHQQNITKVVFSSACALLTFYKNAINHISLQTTTPDENRQFDFRLF